MTDAQSSDIGELPRVPKYIITDWLDGGGIWQTMEGNWMRPVMGVDTSHLKGHPEQLYFEVDANNNDIIIDDKYSEILNPEWDKNYSTGSEFDYDGAVAMLKRIRQIRREANQKKAEGQPPTRRRIRPKIHSVNEVFDTAFLNPVVKTYMEKYEYFRNNGDKVATAKRKAIEMAARETGFLWSRPKRPSKDDFRYYDVLGKDHTLERQALLAEYREELNKWQEGKAKFEPLKRYMWHLRKNQEVPFCEQYYNNKQSGLDDESARLAAVAYMRNDQNEKSYGPFAIDIDAQYALMWKVYKRGATWLEDIEVRHADIIENLKKEYKESD